jgi:hypothetical protein
LSSEFDAARKIPWPTPQGCPGQFKTQQVFTGNDEGDLALEVGIAEWSGEGPPSREAFLKLHKARAGQGINPVVIVAIAGEKAWLFGPNSQAAVVGPLAIDHAQRLIQSALNESSGLAARQSLNQTYEAISATSTGGSEADALRGVGNAGLFATHELRHGVRNRPDWNDACLQSKELMGLRKDELVKKLGYSLEDVGGHASLLRSKGANPRAAAVILLDNETFDGQSNRFSVSPVAFGLGIAKSKEVAWLIVLRKDAIRLYPARLDLGVGRKGLSETYFELNLSVADESTAGFLSLIFSSEALAENGSCYEILKSSAQYAVGLSERLRDNVYGEIVPRLALSVASQFPKLGVVLDRDGLNLAYQITLRIFFRMLFQAYADDRKLLPFGENADYTKNAIKGFAKKFVEEDDIEFDDESPSYWDDLIQVWHAIDTGSKRFGIPAYNGGLFSSDEELQPEGALIEKLRITDDVMGPVLRALLIDAGDDGDLGPIDFRSLSVREFGTIYEGLLESNLGVADTDLVLDDNDTWVPASKGAKLEPGRSAKKGTVYFHDTSGARKGTGSYFTPSFVVDHLLERSLDPALDGHLGRVKQVLEKGDQVGAADLFFDFKVADLAMGSAHFLTAAIDHIEQRMASFLDAHPIPGVTNELRRLEEAAREKLGENASVPEPSSLLRRQIARRCIYGLDINPVAVELARVSIWIHTFVRGLPMSSLDHTLVCANSLTGIGTVEEALNVLVPGRKGGQLGIFDAPIEDALTKARDVLIEVARALELDSKESKAASRASMKAYKDAREAKLLFDAAVLMRIGRGGLVAGADPANIAKMAAKKEVQEVLAPLQPAHMPLLFPEVFLRDNGGFDVLIGNPPWEKLHVEEHQWWGLRFPGLRGLPMAERTKTVKKMMNDRPDLVDEYQTDIENNDAARQVIASGPYPGIGSGHIDLYKAFAWRNWQLLRHHGSLGVVLPRGALNGSGTQKWRREILDHGTFTDVVVTINTGNWVFANVDGRYTTALVVIEKNEGKPVVSFAGPFPNMSEFLQGRDNLVAVPKDEFLSWTGTAAFPLIPDALAGDVFRQMRKSPAFSSTEGFEFRPLQGDLNAASNKDLFNTNLNTAKGDVPVLTGSSFNLWEPDFNNPYGYGSAKTLKHILEKTKNSASQVRSAFNGMKISTAEDLPMNVPRIAFRDVTNATNTRTMLCCLVPPGVALVHKAPYLVRRSGTERDESYVLGVLSSRIFDWYARRLVELGMTFEVLMPMPIPRPAITDKNRQRVVEIAGSLAAVDKRYSKWAKAVGVSVGSVKTPEEREELEIELDALVAHLYGLSREHVAHIYKTFHRGWVEHAPRLVRVLTYYDKIAKAKK